MPRRRPKIDALIAEDHRDAPWLRQRLRPLVGLEAPPASREENFAAWRRFLELLAEDRPSMFLFEDLHWADDALLAFLEHVADYSEGVPMLVIATARPELFERSPAWAAAARNAARVNLSRLTEVETAALVGNLLGQAVLPVEVQAAILARSGGNPLYAEEFVGLLKDRGILTRSASTWRIDPASEVPIPSGVRSLIAARLDALSPENKRMLQDAAVIGEVFWAGAVAEMGERDASEVDAALHELSRKELVRSVRASSMEGQAEYGFFHGLVRDVCYGQIARASRADRHLRAAGWIERVSGERAEDHADILAAHYATALELATASGEPATERLRAKAIRSLARAGDRALGIDVEAAERHYARSLQLAKPGEPERPSILAGYGEVLRQRGRMQESARAYEESIDGLRALGDLRTAAIAMSRFQIVMNRLGDPSYLDMVDEAVALVEPLGPSPELAAALAEQGGAAMVSGDFHAAVAAAERAMAIAAELDLPTPARALGIRGASRTHLGDAGGLDDMRRALEAATVQGLGREAAVLHYNIAEAAWAIEGPKARLERGRDGSDFAGRRGIEEIVEAFGAQAAEDLVYLGRYDEGMAAAADALPRLEAGGVVFQQLLVRSAQVLVHTRRGEYAAARPLAEWGVGQSRELGDPQWLATFLPPAAEVHFRLGEPAVAAALLSELERTPRVRDTPYYSATLADAVRIALAAKAPDLASRLAEGVEPIYPLREHALASARALLAEHRGDHVEAEVSFADATQRWRRFEMPWEQAQALLGRGRTLLALGRMSESIDSLREARDLFLRLGARPSVRETDAVMARATALTS
jgi:tetratricopeptide (TPR) repeat protein